MPAKLGGLWKGMANGVKLPTVSPLSHLWIDWLRRAEIGDWESAPLWHLHAFTG